MGASIKGSQTWVPPKERTRHVCVKASTPITNSKERDVVAGSREKPQDNELEETSGLILRSREGFSEKED